MKQIIYAALLAALLCASPAAAKEILFNTYIATVTDVVDGDNVKVEFAVWLQQTIKTSIRLIGVDTPEIGHRAKCDAELQKGLAAKAFLVKLVKGKTVEITSIKFDAYSGRYDALVFFQGESLNTLLVKRGHAVAYIGRGARMDWCK